LKYFQIQINSIFVRIKMSVPQNQSICIRKLSDFFACKQDTQSKGVYNYASNPYGIVMKTFKLPILPILEDMESPYDQLQIVQHWVDCMNAFCEKKNLAFRVTNATPLDVQCVNLAQNGFLQQKKEIANDPYFAKLI